MNRTSSSHSRARQPRPGRSTSYTPSLRRRNTSGQSPSFSDHDDPEAANTTHTDHVIVEEIASIKRYEDFTTIDWVQDAAREQLRRKARRNRRALGNRERNSNNKVFLGRGNGIWRRKIAEAYDAGQAWIVVTLVGAAIGLNAAFLNIVTERYQIGVLHDCILSQREFLLLGRRGRMSRVEALGWRLLAAELPAVHRIRRRV
jgi:chloride channel 3/4/5